MQSQKQNPIFDLWLAAYESQLTELIQRSREAAAPPDKQSGDSPDHGPKVINK